MEKDEQPKIIYRKFAVSKKNSILKHDPELFMEMQLFLMVVLSSFFGKTTSDIISKPAKNRYQHPFY